MPFLFEKPGGPWSFFLHRFCFQYVFANMLWISCASNSVALLTITPLEEQPNQLQLPLQKHFFFDLNVALFFCQAFRDVFSNRRRSLLFLCSSFMHKGRTCASSLEASARRLHTVCCRHIEKFSIQTMYKRMQHINLLFIDSGLLYVGYQRLSLLFHCNFIGLNLSETEK